MHIHIINHIVVEIKIIYDTSCSTRYCWFYKKYRIQEDDECNIIQSTA